MNFDKTHNFAKDFKKLLKKYRSLEDDLETFKKTIIHVDVACNRKFAVLHKDERIMIIKARFFCKYLKGNTLRIVYVQYKTTEKIDFIEIFFKGDKSREDNQRIKEFLKNCN
jgi:hypothetical protein